MALTVAMPVMLLSGYVGSYLAVNSATNDVFASRSAWPIWDRFLWFWYPIITYERSDLPLSTELHALDIWCWNFGGLEWAECYAGAKIAKPDSRTLPKPRN